MSAPAADASANGAGAQSRPSSRGSQLQQSAAGAPAARALLRRSCNAASVAGADSGVEALRMRIEAQFSGVPFEERPAWAQLVLLTDVELVGTVLACWWPDELYVDLIDGWETAELEAVCERLSIVISSVGGMRTSIKKRVERWAMDNPALVPLDPSDAAPRKRTPGAKAAKAAAIAQRAAKRSAPKVQYSDNDGGAATEQDDSDADSYYSPPARSNSRGRSPARAESRRGAGSRELSKELVAALSSLPSVSASAPPRDREPIRSGRRGAAAPAAPADRSGRAHRSRRRDSCVSSSSSSSNSDSDAVSLESEEEERPAYRLSSRHSSNRSSSSRSTDESFASDWIHNVLLDGTTVHERYTSVTAKWTSERNRKEALVLAKIIDLIRLGHPRKALDKAVRRIAGVHSAESSGSWTLSSVLENNMEAQSFLPARAWSAAAKVAARIETMRKSTQGAGGSGSSAGKDKSKSSGGSSSSSGSCGRNRDSSSGTHDAKSTGSNK